MLRPARTAAMLLGVLALVGCASSTDQVVDESPAPSGEPCPGALAADVEALEGLVEAEVPAFLAETGLPERYPPSCVFADEARALAFFPLEGGALVDAIEGELSVDDVEILSPPPDLVALLPDGGVATFTEASIDDASRTYDDAFDGIDYVVVDVSSSSP